jgi:hypothetical protein
MREKTVVFCEGIREATLISIILEQTNIRYKIIPHEDLERSHSKEIAPENNRINRFLGRDGQGIKYLLKDEGGFAKCVDSFLNLYEDNIEKYLGIVVIDSADARDYVKNRFRARLQGRDVLKRESENLYLTKDPKSSRSEHRIFLTPDTLETQVRKITGKNLGGQDRNGMRKTLVEFKHECLRRRIDWFHELKETLLSDP